jgi:hypothetical protein
VNLESRCKRGRPVDLTSARQQRLRSSREAQAPVSESESGDDASDGHVQLPLKQKRERYDSGVMVQANSGLEAPKQTQLDSLSSNSINKEYTGMLYWFLWLYRVRIYSNST